MNTILTKLHMSFVRSKNINWNQYFYLVETYRIEGQIKQKVLKYLWKDPSWYAPEASVAITASSPSWGDDSLLGSLDQALAPDINKHIQEAVADKQKNKEFKDLGEKF